SKFQRVYREPNSYSVVWRRRGLLMVGSSVKLPSERQAKTNPTILLVDDEILLRMLIAEELRHAGYLVIEAAHAAEALDVLAQNVDVNLVLSDIQMPGTMDGVGLSRVVRSTYPAIKIILISGRVVDGVEHDGFFDKPCDFAKILKHIEMLLDLG